VLSSSFFAHHKRCPVAKLGILSTNGRFEFVNQHWIDKLGWTAQDLAQLDDPWTAFYPDPDYRQEVMDFISGSDDIWQESQTLTRQNGIIITRWGNVRLSDGRIIGIGQDVTELRQAQQHEFQIKLERERRHLLTTFFQNAAHEFRTPLATINSGVYLMSRSDDPDRRKQKAKQIEGQIQRITRLVDNLLLMTRLDSDNALANDPVDIEQILRTACKLAYENCPGNHNLHVEIQPDLPSVMGDADYLSDALEEIIDNACRFTPEDGKIDVQAGSTNDHIWIEIRDTGPGIVEDDLPHIFETFWRQDVAHSTPGFGLGLPAARRIIEQHGGEVTVMSHPGAGTRVTVTLPLVTDIDVTSA
jgi:signal transduction histidine kinase